MREGKRLRGQNELKEIVTEVSMKSLIGQNGVLKRCQNVLKRGQIPE